MLKQFFLTLIFILVLTACQSGTAVIPTNSPLPATQFTPSPIPTTASPTDTPLPPTEAGPTPTHIRIDLTPAQLAAIATLEKDKGLPANDIKLVSTESVQWDNGCLGIVIPGVMCTKGPVDGFKIVLSGQGTAYEYHTNQDGTNVLLVKSPMIRIAVRLLDNSIQIVPIDILNIPSPSPTDHSFMPAGGAIGDTVYALSLSPSPAVMVDANGSHVLDFIHNPNYGLAVWPGNSDHTPRLAWGTQLDYQTMQTSLMMSAPDGSQLQTLISETVASDASPYQIVAHHWSVDGSSLYFSKEPYGIGGYIPFNGASSLYRIDLASKQVSEIIPINFKQGGLICLDALAPDYSMVADHCTQGVITVRNLDTTHSVTILPPKVVKDRGILGSARFSPDGSRLAFAGARGDPDAEQGWLAVSNGLGSDSNIVITSQTNQYFIVLGWLDNNTLLVQSNAVKCDQGICTNEIWTVPIDGTNPNKVTDGTFVTFVDGYQP